MPCWRASAGQFSWPMLTGRGGERNADAATLSAWRCAKMKARRHYYPGAEPSPLAAHRRSRLLSPTYCRHHRFRAMPPLAYHCRQPPPRAALRRAQTSKIRCGHVDALATPALRCSSRRRRADGTDFAYRRKARRATISAPYILSFEISIRFCSHRGVIYTSPSRRAPCPAIQHKCAQERFPFALGLPRQSDKQMMTRVVVPPYPLAQPRQEENRSDFARSRRICPPPASFATAASGRYIEALKMPPLSRHFSKISPRLFTPLRHKTPGARRRVWSGL